MIKVIYENYQFQGIFLCEIFKGLKKALNSAKYINSKPKITKFIMKIFVLLCLISLCLFASVQGYSLNGDWVLSTEHLDFSQGKQSTNVIFSFSELVNSQKQIVNQITVKTCRVMFYTFTYRQNTIVPIFARFGNNTRECVGQEVNQVRRKMESIFYFSIIDNRLILIYPSKQIGFVLFKNSTIPQGIKGKWDTIQINGKKIDKQTIQFGENKVSLCSGTYVLDYKVDSGNKINIKAAQGVSNGQCQLDEIINTLKNSQYYAKNEDSLKLYSGDVQIILKGEKTKIKPTFKPFDKQILHNKWYIYSLNGTNLDQKSEPIYYYYFLIITPQRFRFYGGCNVEFSFYDFINGNEVNHRDVNYVKKPSCRYVNEDTLVLNSLFSQGKYLQFNSDTSILTFYDESLNNIMEFTTVIPKTRDILPPSNL